MADWTHAFFFSLNICLPMTIKKALGEEKRINELYQEIPRRREADKGVELTQFSAFLSTTNKRRGCILCKYWEGPALEAQGIMEMAENWRTHGKSRKWAIADISWHHDALITYSVERELRKVSKFEKRHWSKCPQLLLTLRPCLSHRTQADRIPTVNGSWSKQKSISG